MAESMKVTGKTISNMASERKSGTMELKLMKENF
jgi:hypothetical protein